MKHTLLTAIIGLCLTLSVNAVMPSPHPMNIVTDPIVYQDGTTIVLEWQDTTDLETSYDVMLRTKRNGSWGPYMRVAVLPPDTTWWAVDVGDDLHIMYEFRIRTRINGYFEESRPVRIILK